MSTIWEWLQNSPVSSVLGIILVVALVLVALKLIKTVTRPLLIIILVVGAVLIVLGIVDLTLLAATGKKLLQTIWDSIYAKGVDAISNSDLNPVNMLK